MTTPRRNDVPRSLRRLARAAFRRDLGLSAKAAADLDRRLYQLAASKMPMGQARKAARKLFEGARP